MEHRDGTGHACTSRSWQSNGKSKPRPILYYKDSEVTYVHRCLCLPPGLNVTNYSLDDTAHPEIPPAFALRTEQLEFRNQEIYIAYQAFSRFIENDSSLELETIDNSMIDREIWSSSSPSSRGPVLCSENVTLAGHSFGGCTVVSSFRSCARNSLKLTVI